MNMADRLARFVVETTLNDIPRDTVRFTKERHIKIDKKTMVLAG